MNEMWTVEACNLMFIAVHSVADWLIQLDMKQVSVYAFTVSLVPWNFAIYILYCNAFYFICIIMKH